MCYHFQDEGNSRQQVNLNWALSNIPWKEQWDPMIIRHLLKASWCLKPLATSDRSLASTFISFTNRVGTADSNSKITHMTSKANVPLYDRVFFVYSLRALLGLLPLSLHIHKEIRLAAYTLRHLIIEEEANETRDTLLLLTKYWRSRCWARQQMTWGLSRFLHIPTELC